MAKVFILGNLTHDPEVLTLESGVKAAKFTVATNRNWTNKHGETFEKTDYHKITVWRKLAEICLNYLKKGSAVMIEGSLNNTEYVNKDGKKIKNTEITADEVNFITNKKKEVVDEINLVEVA